jgi:hypothetical protein
MTRSFDELRHEIDADHVRRENVNQIKADLLLSSSGSDAKREVRCDGCVPDDSA